MFGTVIICRECKSIIALVEGSSEASRSEAENMALTKNANIITLPAEREEDSKYAVCNDCRILAEELDAMSHG